LENGQVVDAVVRSKDTLSDVEENPKLNIIEASILDMDQPALKGLGLVQSSDVTISCLGYGKQIFGEPKRILFRSAAMILGSMTSKTKFIMLNGAAARHPDRSEVRSWLEHIVLGLLSYFIPPHRDMEDTLGLFSRDKQRNWIVVRPGMFKNGSMLSSYSLTEYRTVGIFSARVATKSNVADSIVKMATSSTLQQRWNRKMPVVIDDLN
jgi:hypothetical protein